MLVNRAIRRFQPVPGRYQIFGYHGILQHRARMMATQSGVQQAKQKMRRGIILASVGFGCLLVAPAFYLIGDIASRKPPPCARDIVGTWESEKDEEGVKATMKFNPYNVCDYRNVNGKDGRGPVDWNAPETSSDESGPSEIYVGFPKVGSKEPLKIDQWPERDEQGNLTMVAEGVRFVKTK
eukprot:gb/GECG01012838.1/.p1 GENE.gb/GECG01012838.1/~~gb/GECG01012838.1/.p1  ORF type:complete len:181 (+),score=16.54 gb/GECG01012838.1/:1-543(+)